MYQKVQTVNEDFGSPKSSLFLYRNNKPSKRSSLLLYPRIFLDYFHQYKNLIHSNSLFQIQPHDNLIVFTLKSKLDFNAIAKGYAVDVISEFLNSKSIDNYMVDIGGEIRTSATILAQAIVNEGLKNVTSYFT